LAAGIEAYNNSDYDKALESLHKVLENKEQYSSKELAECHRYIAMIHIAYVYLAKARGHFVQALEYDPQLGFDESLTSPKILQTFEDAKKEFENKDEEPAPVAVTEPPPVQKANSKTVAGWTLIGVGSASLITSGITYGLMYQKTSQAQTAIDDNNEPLYDALVNDHGTLGIISGTTLGIGLVATGVGTYLLVTGKSETASIPIGKYRVAVLPGPASGLTFSFKF
jgi:tetratricopeptide (TPR) repeat protein